MFNVTRIAYNGKGWQRPDGLASKLEYKKSYTYAKGYGHEDWLFRNDWLIAGWRYAFLQGVGKSHARLLRENQPFDVTLYTIDERKQRRFIGRILEVECLNAAQAEEAKEIFIQQGWLAAMRDDVLSIKGDVSSLADTTLGRHLVNVRFRLQNVSLFHDKPLVPPESPIQAIKRYTFSAVPDLQVPALMPPAHREASLPSTDEYTRKGTGPTQVTPEHARLQRALIERLRNAHGGDDVRPEFNYIDVFRQNSTEVWLYEIKSDLAPRSVLRQAIGQLLEYAHFMVEKRGLLKGRQLYLVAVGRRKLTDADEEYLAHLQLTFRLPISYIDLPIYDSNG